MSSYIRRAIRLRGCVIVLVSCTNSKFGSNCIVVVAGVLSHCTERGRTVSSHVDDLFD